MTKKTIGILIEDRKYESLGLQRLLQSTRSDNIQFKKIESTQDLEKQGPFDVIVHKTVHLMLTPTSTEFCSLKNYFQSNSVISIDPIDAILILLDRFQQYKIIHQSLSDYGMQNLVFVPPFCLYNDAASAHILANHDVKFPILVKPRSAHGKKIAHEMMLIFNENGFKKIQAPSLLQSFENHSGFLVKAYVIGAYYHLVTRPSIRNLSNGDQEPIEFCSHDISKEASKSILNDQKPLSSINDVNIDHDLVRRIVDCLRRNLRLDLFGVDLIICDPDADSGVSKLAIIDVNIFPDYSCVPDFLVHLENLCRRKLSLPELSLPVH